MKQNAKKKLLIIFSVFLAIVILIVLGSTVFTLQKASLVFLHYDENTGETVYVDAPGKTAFACLSRPIIGPIRKSELLISLA